MDPLNDREALFQAALLHDLGKFIERGKLSEWYEKTQAYERTGEASRDYAHRLYSAAFIRDYAANKHFLARKAETLALWHHRGSDPAKQDFEPIEQKGVLLKLLRIADDCASAERQEDAALEPQKYYLARLRSPFSDIEMKLDRTGETLRAPESMYLNAEPLSIRRSALFPETKNPSFDTNPYTCLVRQFLDEFKRIDALDGLYALMEKYLHAVPAQTPVKFNNVERLAVPDINLFDHSRTVAAIALCLYDEYRDGAWRGQDDRILSKDHETLPPPCLLVRGDVSGIQDFIFNIKSKGAAKQLKARSFYVQLLTRVVSRFIMDRLDLRAANLLFDGGGNFYMLVPHCRAGNLETLRNELERACLYEDLYLSLGWTPVSVADFKQGGFPAKWKEAFEACEHRKRRRFQGLGLRVFEPFAPRDEDRLVKEFRKLTGKLSKAKGMRIVSGQNEADVPGPLFQTLGYGIRLPEREDRKAVVFNDTDFAGTWAGFEFLVNRLPRWTREMADTWNKNHPDEKEPAHAGGIVEFQRLAEQAEERTGTDKLGVLKLDVDNLGKLFTDGLPENSRTIGRIASLSRTLKWFFEGYVNHLLDEGTFKWMAADGSIKEAGFGPELYVIFSGGDDFFAVGAWDAVFAFARRLRAEFDAFTGRHPGITFSAALLVVDPSYPVTQFARLAEERLEAAKHADDRKNRINVLGEVLTWNEFDAAAGIRDRLAELVKRHGASRAVINKVRRSSVGYGRLQALVTRRGRLPLERLWRLGYYLRDVVKKHTPPAVEKHVNALVAEHEKRLLDVFTGKTDAYNPAFFAVGARWAELETRKKERASKPAET